MPQIIVTVPRDHTKPTKIEVSGCPGPSCQSLTEGLERALGQRVAQDLTDEYYQPPVQQQNTQHLQ